MYEEVDQIDSTKIGALHSLQAADNRKILAGVFDKTSNGGEKFSNLFEQKFKLMS